MELEPASFVSMASSCAMTSRSHRWAHRCAMTAFFLKNVVLYLFAHFFAQKGQVMECLHQLYIQRIPNHLHYH